ncbi:hypothetical protein Tco_0728195 [Tanacetum coccineum]|uniref:Uncharacterized protein n=1 Tax=Tanacetum coccineum TaxID=301880 RepID=A0ABQ4YKG1_9ASTR
MVGERCRAKLSSKWTFRKISINFELEDRLLFQVNPGAGGETGAGGEVLGKVELDSQGWINDGGRKTGEDSNLVLQTSEGRLVIQQKFVGLVVVDVYGLENECACKK